MSAYAETINSKDLSYSSPKVSEQKLDAGGNYVSPAPESGAPIKPHNASGGIG